MRPIHYQPNHHEQQLSTTALSAAAETGEVGRHRGLLPERFHQAPADLLNQGWRRFLDHGPMRHPAPKPSAASQPTPNRRSI